MKRNEIIERIYELLSSNPTDNDLYIHLSELLSDILHDKISITDAEVVLRKNDPQYIRYEFLQNLSGKPIYNNIKDYKNGKLSDIQILKMVSSLVTQILIQKEKNSELDVKALQMGGLLSILTNYENTGVVNISYLDDLLYNFGWKDD